MTPRRFAQQLLSLLAMVAVLSGMHWGGKARLTVVAERQDSTPAEERSEDEEEQSAGKIQIVRFGEGRKLAPLREEAVPAPSAQNFAEHGRAIADSRWHPSSALRVLLPRRVLSDGDDGGTRA